MKREFCSVCGASIPPRYGEGTCKVCDPVGVAINKEKKKG